MLEKLTPIQKGLFPNASHTFDPFSRYVPLRVEARLDDVLMEYLYQSSRTTKDNTNNFFYLCTANLGDHRLGSDGRFNVSRTHAPLECRKEPPPICLC